MIFNGLVSASQISRRLQKSPALGKVKHAYLKFLHSLRSKAYLLFVCIYSFIFQFIAKTFIQLGFRRIIYPQNIIQ